MKKMLLTLGVCIALSQIAACSTSHQAEQDPLAAALAKLPPVKNSTEATQRLIAMAAGYCKGMAETKGADFAACFKEQTDYMIQRIQNGPAKSQDNNSPISVNFRTTDIDGQKVALADTLELNANGATFCQQYIKDVSSNPADGEWDVTIDKHCESNL